MKCQVCPLLQFLQVALRDAIVIEMDHVDACGVQGVGRIFRAGQHREALWMLRQNLPGDAQAS